VCENQLIIYDNEISSAVISAPEKRFKDNEINHNLTFQLAKKQIEKLEELKNCFLARYFIMPEVFFRDLRSYKIRLVINDFAIISPPPPLFKVALLSIKGRECMNLIYSEPPSNDDIAQFTRVLMTT